MSSYDRRNASGEDSLAMALKALANIETMLDGAPAQAFRFSRDILRQMATVARDSRKLADKMEAASDALGEASGEEDLAEAIQAARAKLSKR